MAVLIAGYVSKCIYWRLLHIRLNKNISVFRVAGLKILGRVGTHIFFLEKIEFDAFLKAFGL